MSQSIIKDHIQGLRRELGHVGPSELLRWGAERFNKDIVLACSFGAEDIVLLDMLVQVCPEPAVFYLDTGLHFAETYATRDRLTERYKIQFIQVKPDLTLQEQALQYGEGLWLENPDKCCHLRKVEPLINILNQYDAWITGIRREQAVTRANAETIEWDAKFDMLKLNPLALWSHDQVWSYIKEHDLPYNPLHDQNYPSIGCSVCTKPVLPGEDLRAGRWNGKQKTECGLHK